MEGVFTMLRFLGFRKWKVVLLLILTVGGVIIAIAENGFDLSRTWDDLSGTFSGTPTPTVYPYRAAGGQRSYATVTPTRVPKPTRTPIPTQTPIPTATPRTTIPRVIVYGTPTPRSSPIPSGRAPKGYMNGTPLTPRTIEDLVIEYTNAERDTHGLPPLTADPAISEIARTHSKHMASSNNLSHDLNGRGPTDRALDAGYNCRYSKGDGTRLFGFSENVAAHPRLRGWSGYAGQPHSWEPTDYSADDEAAAKRLVDRWMDSPGHRENILDADNRRIGVGVTVILSVKYSYFQETVWATQNFSPCGE